jgi:hypothetical protein
MIYLGMDFLTNDYYEQRALIAHELTHSADAKAVGLDELKAQRRREAERYGEEEQYKVRGTIEWRANQVGGAFRYPEMAPK